MLETLEELKSYGSIFLLVGCVFFIAASGILFGITYYMMDYVQTAFEDTDCVIENNTLVSSCQDLWAISLYPFLNLKDLIVWFSIFFIFSLVLAMLLTGYNSGKSPIYLGLMTIFIAVLTYLGIVVSNMYRQMLENDLLRSMLVDFTVYHNIMMYLPWFCFFVGLLSVMLGFVNYQRTGVNRSLPEELDY